MAGQIRLFEKTAGGLLVQVAPDRAEAVRDGRIVSRMSMEVDVLWTPEEKAQRDAEEQAAREAAAARAAEQAQMKTRRQAALAKLGLADDELEALGIAR